MQVDNPWDAFADDQLGLMDHLGIREFFYMGYCIGGCFAGKLLQRAPNRVVAAVFCQSVGHRPENPTVMYRHSKENWVPDFMKGRPDVSMETIEKYLHNLYAVQPDFLYSVSRDFIRNCRTPMLALPDDVPGHPLQTSIDVASLAPNAEITVYPWKEPEELRQRTLDRVRPSYKHTSRCALQRSSRRFPSTRRPRKSGARGKRTVGFPWISARARMRCSTRRSTNETHGLLPQSAEPFILQSAESRPFVSWSPGGTEGSNPSSSSGEFHCELYSWIARAEDDPGPGSLTSSGFQKAKLLERRDAISPAPATSKRRGNHR